MCIFVIVNFRENIFLSFVSFDSLIKKLMVKFVHANSASTFWHKLLNGLLVQVDANWKQNTLCFSEMLFYVWFGFVPNRSSTNMLVRYYVWDLILADLSVFYQNYDRPATSLNPVTQSAGAVEYMAWTFAEG